MLSREILEAISQCEVNPVCCSCLAYGFGSKKCERWKVADSHIAALDEIDRLKVELAVMHDILRDKENPQADCSTKFYVDRTKHLVQDSGNLLIPKREEGSIKA